MAIKTTRELGRNLYWGELDAWFFGIEFTTGGFDVERRGARGTQRRHDNKDDYGESQLTGLYD